MDDLLPAGRGDRQEAATIGLRHRGTALCAIGEISSALTPLLGSLGGTVLFGLGMLGAALVTAWFYLTYALAYVAGAALVLASVNLVRLSVDVEVMNALLPIVLGFLLALEARVPPRQWRMRGIRKYLTWSLCALVIGFALYLTAAAVR